MLGAILFGLTLQSATGDFIDNGTLSAERIAADHLRIFGTSQTFGEPSAVRLLRVRYVSQNPLNNRSSWLSGLVALPTKGAPRGLLLYCHGTTATRSQAPSRMTPTNPIPGARDAVTAFCAAGFAVALPDYYGLGDDVYAHPYPLSAVNARSSIDMLPVARATAQRVGISVAEGLYVAGYSEGGGVAAWCARLLQDRPMDVNHLIMSAALSGPYDLSGVTLTSTLSDQSNPMYLGARLFFLSLIGVSTDAYLGVPLEELFVPSFASYVRLAYRTSANDAELAERIAMKGFQLGAVRSVRRVVQPAALKALTERDPSHPLVRALMANDIVNWTPRRPILVVSLANDFVVTPKNAEEAVAAWRSDPVGAANVRAVVIPNPKLNHVTGEPPAILKARQAFVGGLDSL